MEAMEEEGAGADLKDTFESELDKAFMKFSTRLSHNPEQVLRYEYRGTPLLCSYADPVGKLLHREQSGRVTTVGGGHMPRCEYCGAQRVFEVQLVPHAISILEDGRPGVGLGEGDAGMEWGTIIMGVCSKDCAPEALWQTGWREEWAGVQWEEMK
jgi:pre-rRNA-processing protein TSR4